MKDSIKRITISGESGYGFCAEAYHDKITIEPYAIRYDYIPVSETDINPLRKWSYRTTSPIFRYLYDSVCDAIAEVMMSDDSVFYTDVGSISFCITLSSGKKEKKTFRCPGETFKDCFSVIKKMVPDCEYVPATLLTDEDYSE